jgi:hypothetical protein
LLHPHILYEHFEILLIGGGVTVGQLRNEALAALIVGQGTGAARDTVLEKNANRRLIPMPWQGRRLARFAGMNQRFDGDTI